MAHTKEIVMKKLVAKRPGPLTISVRGPQVPFGGGWYQGGLLRGVWQMLRYFRRGRILEVRWLTPGERDAAQRWNQADLDRVYRQPQPEKETHT